MTLGSPPWSYGGMTINDRIGLFHSLHVSDPVLRLPNCWDAASARIMEDAGAVAVGTTSAAAAWSLGKPDGDALSPVVAAAAAARIVDAVSVPVTVDIEAGYGQTPTDVADTVSAVIDAGAAGVNIEDVHPDDPGRLREPGDNAVRLTSARKAAERHGVNLFINARIDTYLRGVGAAHYRFGDTIARANTYLDAGASGIFVPGVTDVDTIIDLVREIAAPVNVMLDEGSPTPGELGRLGVARVSVGPGIAAAAYGIARSRTHEFLGIPGPATEMVDYHEMNSLFAR
jgi:2-methylisocitrate lyase-like PEP mutase family enzyme